MLPETPTAEGRDSVAEMNPTRISNILFDCATSRSTLDAAWRKIRSQLENSNDGKVRSDTALFAVNVQKSIVRLQRSLRSGTFAFRPQRGYLKKRASKPGDAPKEPRPIVIAPAESRIVQRAILDVCQSSDLQIPTKSPSCTDVMAPGIPG